MRTDTAQLLLELIRAINTEHPKDFVDLVCSARDTLPSTTEQELMAIIEAPQSALDLPDKLQTQCQTNGKS
jgi:hypothetical protein